MENFEKYITNLPVIPDVASKIMGIPENNFDISFKELEEIIMIDPMLTARILKVANSALYARQNEIINLKMAIGLLGFKNIKSLVMLITAAQFSRNLASGDYLNRFWRHSIATAFIAKHLMHRKKERQNEELAFVAGLLHDIGQVALFQSEPSVYEDLLSSITDDQDSIETLEQRVFNTDHREIGAGLLAHWNFPEVYVDSAKEHNTLNVDSKNRSLVLTVTLADLLSEFIGYGQRGDSREGLLTEVLSLTDHTEDDLAFFKSDYKEIFEEDPLFRECQRLFTK